MSRAARLAELKALRAAGKKRVYEVEEAQSLYDEVDEEGYKNIVRSRLDRDDFVVGDGGEGYADDGREEWHTEKYRGYDTGSEDEQPLRGKAGACGVCHLTRCMLTAPCSKAKARRRPGKSRESQQ